MGQEVALSGETRLANLPARLVSGQNKSGIIPLVRPPALDAGDEIGDNTACLVPSIQEFLSTLQRELQGSVAFSLSHTGRPLKSFLSNQPRGHNLHFIFTKLWDNCSLGSTGKIGEIISLFQGKRAWSDRDFTLD